MSSIASTNPLDGRQSTMDRKLEEDLVSRAPRFWRYYRDSSYCLSFGMECGDGWFPILANLSDAINDLDTDCFAVQCKSKFGGLRVYVENGTPEIHRLIRGAESLAIETCEKCGERGRDHVCGTK